MRPDDRKGGQTAAQVAQQTEGKEGAQDNKKGSGSQGASSSMGPKPDKRHSKDKSREERLQDLLNGLIISQVKAPFVYVEEGLVKLMKDCLMADSVSCYPFFSHAALCGYIDHFEENEEDQDVGWGCGWRNIQLLCSFLLAEDAEAREVLFNGVGFVPDITALQLWLEVAWNKGFDEPGAKFFNWSIAGTSKWIGTTECAALLRSFGVRARIVSFTALGGKRVRNNTKNNVGTAIDLNGDGGNQREPESSMSGGGGLEPENPGGKQPEGAQGGNGGPSSDEKSGSGGKAEEDSTRKPECDGSQGGCERCDECNTICEEGTRYRGLVEKDSHLCDDCMKSASQEPSSGELQYVHEDSNARLDPSTPENYPQRHVQVPTEELENWNLGCTRCGESLSGIRYKSLKGRNYEICEKCMQGIEDNPEESGSRKDYVVIEDFPLTRGSSPPTKEEKKEGNSGNSNQQGDKEEGGETSNKDGNDSKSDDNNQTASERGEDGDDDNERKKAGMNRSSSGLFHGTDHHHLIEWVWSYFTDGPYPRYSVSAANRQDVVTMSKRSPIYFQHRGHSRVVVGMERRRKPDGLSEDVYLLVLDPSVKTNELVKALREKKGWRELIKHDVRTLKESEYQLCYADPGIASGEELEQLKVLSSLRYSYY